MTLASTTQSGIGVTFADGCQGVIPFSKIPELGDRKHLTAIELPNPYVVIIHTSKSETVELPWDFVRHYCDSSYRPRVEAIAAAGAQSLGQHIRAAREAAGMTQAELASAARIGRVTEVRIENGEQSPRYETLAALARALRRPVADFFAGESAA